MYQWRKDIASWKAGKTLYMSIPFTWLLPAAEEMARSHRGPVIAGGPAVKLIPVAWAKTPELIPYDVLAFHNPCATFTSRGCPNSCGFCAVPKLEPEFHEYLAWKPAPLICDNNLLACSKRHFLAVIESLLRFPFVDFNQGLEARRLTEWHVTELKRLRHARMRFGFDFLQEAKDVEKAIDLCRYYGLTDISVYCLIGFDDTPALAKERLELARSWGLRPFAMRFQPLDCLVKNNFVLEGWTDPELRKVMKYYNRLRWNEHIPYDDFQYTQKDDSPALQEELEFS